MAFEIKTTKQLLSDRGIKCLVYGQAGSGKTSLSLGLDRPLIVSAENGLLSISDEALPDLDVAVVKSKRECDEVIDYLVSTEGRVKYRSVVIDSISEIAELYLIDEKSANKDPRAAYGEVQDGVAELIRRIVGLTHNVLTVAKVEHGVDELGGAVHLPSMPGRKLGASLPYFFDEVFAARVINDPTAGVPRHVLQTRADGVWQAKDRSGKLNMFEINDNPLETMRGIFAKIRGSADQ